MTLNRKKFEFEYASGGDFVDVESCSRLIARIRTHGLMIQTNAAMRVVTAVTDNIGRPGVKSLLNIEI